MIPNNNNQISPIIDENLECKATLYDPVLESYPNEKSLTSKTVNSLTRNKVKPIPSRIDYNFFNYCSICELKYPKQVLRCKDCNQKIRTRPWHRSKIIDQKRI
jgi:hypothetical protein